jgi:hypothetical protein
MNARQISLLSILTALCLAVQLLPRPPNVEFTSLIVFTTGVIFGGFAGIMLGSLVMIVNGFISSYGFAGIVIPFQILGMSLIGLIGGLFKKFANDGAVQLCIKAAMFGALLTLAYDFITNVGYAIMFSLPITLVLIWGLTFSLIHMVSNAIIFGSMMVPLSRISRRMLGR